MVQLISLCYALCRLNFIALISIFEVNTCRHGVIMICFTNANLQKCIINKRKAARVASNAALIDGRRVNKRAKNSSPQWKFCSFNGEIFSPHSRLLKRLSKLISLWGYVSGVTKKVIYAFSYHLEEIVQMPTVFDKHHYEETVALICISIYLNKFLIALFYTSINGLWEIVSFDGTDTSLVTVKFFKY